MPKAVGLASILLEHLKNRIERIEIVPSEGGVFEVSLDGKVLFSKKETGRFPTDEETMSFL